MKKYPIIYVKWEDHAGIEGYALLEDAQEVSVVENESVGFLIKEDKEKIIIVGSLAPKDGRDDRDKVLSVLMILKKNILEREELVRSNE